MYLKIFIPIVLILLVFQKGSSQTPFNYVYSQDSTASIDQILYQDDEHLYTYNYRNYFQYNTIGYINHKISKKSGEHTVLGSFYIPNNELFNSWKPILNIEEKKVLLPLQGKYGIYSILVDLESGQSQVVDTLRYPDATSILYPTDVMQIADTIVYLSAVISPSRNTTYRSITYRTPNFQNTIEIPNDNPLYDYSTGRFYELENKNFIVFGNRLRTNLQGTNTTFTEVDRNGNIISQILSPDNDRSTDVEDAIQLNNDEYLLLCLSSTEPPVSFTAKFFHTVYRYNHKTKKIVWKHRITKGITEKFGGRSSIIAGHRPDEYLYASSASSDDTGQDTSYAEGRIIKLKGDGSIVWAKSYSYFTLKWSINRFYDIISSDTSHYFAGGTSTNSSFNPWLIKIDEDGDIVPIDTTSGANQIDLTIPDIKIYPNPATDYLIINQGEISDITYTIYDTQGRLIKQMQINHAHHNTVWEISDIASGMYILSISKQGRILQSKSLVVK